MTTASIVVTTGSLDCSDTNEKTRKRERRIENMISLSKQSYIKQYNTIIVQYKVWQNYIQ